MTNCKSQNYCLDSSGCPDWATTCPDFRSKRYDTKPSFEVEIKECNSPIDLTDTVVEASMWATGKLKYALSDTEDYFPLADNIGFTQSLVGDIIVVSDNPRTPEQMLVTGFDETNNLIRVQRGYNGTNVFSYKRGTKLRLFRFLNAIGTTEMVLTDVPQPDGTTEEDVLTKSKIGYEWAAQDTCLPGCYYLELKLLKMTAVTMNLSDNPSYLPSYITPSFTVPSAGTLSCQLGEGVEWVRRYPVDKEGYLIHIVDTSTSESLI